MQLRLSMPPRPRCATDPPCLLRTLQHTSSSDAVVSDALQEHAAEGALSCAEAISAAATLVESTDSVDSHLWHAILSKVQLAASDMDCEAHPGVLVNHQHSTCHGTCLGIEACMSQAIFAGPSSVHTYQSHRWVSDICGGLSGLQEAIKTLQTMLDWKMNLAADCLGRFWYWASKKDEEQVSSRAVGWGQISYALKLCMMEQCPLLSPTACRGHSLHSS